MAKRNFWERIHKDDVKVAKLAEKIKPTIRCGGDLYYIEPVHLWEMSYIWDPQPTTKAGGLKPLADVPTYHIFGHPAMFKPTIGEVISRIPEKILKKVVAFELIEKPSHVNDLNREHEAMSAGYHTAKVRLYGKE